MAKKFKIEVSVGDEETVNSTEAEAGSVIPAISRGIRDLRKGALKGRRLKVLHVTATELE